MSAVRLVLYAEGAGESAGESTLLPAPGEGLREEHLGAAHVLVRRCVVEVGNLPEGAVRFVSPLRLGARHARGSDLLDRRSLRRLLTWPTPGRRPDLGVVLVDNDGDDERRKVMNAHVEALGLGVVIGVAKQEFEAWLIADHLAVRTIFGRDPGKPPAVEDMTRAEAKQLLAIWTDKLASNSKPREVRVDLARRASLDSLRTLKAFARFLDELRTALQRVQAP